jgi:hypothetical protein
METLAVEALVLARRSDAALVYIRLEEARTRGARALRKTVCSLAAAYASMSGECWPAPSTGMHSPIVAAPAYRDRVKHRNI